MTEQGKKNVSDVSKTDHNELKSKVQLPIQYIESLYSSSPFTLAFEYTKP